MDAEVAGWKVSLNDRAPAPESQDTLQIAAALQRWEPENAFPGVAVP
jgi:hypothetical protein